MAIFKNLQIFIAVCEYIFYKKDKISFLEKWDFFVRNFLLKDENYLFLLRDILCSKIENDWNNRNVLTPLLEIHFMVEEVYLIFTFYNSSFGGK